MYRLSGRKHREREVNSHKNCQTKKYVCLSCLETANCWSHTVLSTTVIDLALRSLVRMLQYLFKFHQEQCLRVLHPLFMNKLSPKHKGSTTGFSLMLCVSISKFYPFSYSAAAVFVYVSLGVTLAEISIKKIRNMRSNVTRVRSCFLVRWTAESG